jgi:flagellin-like protein
MKIFRKDDEAVSPVIAVILMVAITVVLAGVLWAMLSQLGGSEEQNIAITAKQPSEKNYGWMIEITDISGTLSLEDAKFQVVNSEGILEYSVTTNDVSPAAFTKGSSQIYAMTKGSGVTAGNTSTAIDDTTALSDYSGCYVAFVDQTADGKVGGGDVLYIYSDYDADSVNEVTPNYEVKIMAGSEMAMNKAL